MPFVCQVQPGANFYSWITWPEKYRAHNEDIESHPSIALANGWCNNIPGESSSPSSTGVRAGALTQHEELYISWNSFLNLNIIAKKGITVWVAIALQLGLTHCCVCEFPRKAERKTHQTQLCLGREWSWSWRPRKSSALEWRWHGSGTKLDTLQAQPLSPKDQDKVSCTF